MNWERYYQEKKVVPFSEQAPYYAYLLDSWGREVIGANEKTVAILGGMNPNATRPEHFESLCRDFLGSAKTVVLDQNMEAMRKVGRSASVGVVGSLEKMPFKSSEIGLLICDFTLDFMTDDQVREFDKSWSEASSPNALALIAMDNPLSKLLAMAQYRACYGLEVYYREPKRLVKLLSNLKMVYCAEAGKQTSIVMLAHRDLPVSEHVGEPFVLGEDSANYQKWWAENWSKF